MRFFGKSSDRAIAQLIADAQAAKDTGDLDRAQGLYRRATDLLFEENRAEEAIAFFTNAREYTLAAEAAERIQDFARSAKLWFRAADFVRAARARLKSGDEQGALDLLEDAKEYLEAAKIAERRKNFERACQLYEKAGDKHLAANALAQMLRGDDVQTLPREEFHAISSRAARLYAESGKIDRAIKIARWAGQDELAAELLIESGKSEDAIALLRGADKLTYAVDIMRKAGDEKRAHKLLAEDAERHRKFAEAATLYEQAEELGQAARMYESANQPGRAAELYERSKDLQQAAALYERAGQIEDAARCLSLLGQKAEAQSLLKRSTKHEEIVRNFAAAGDHLNAASGLIALARRGDSRRYFSAIEHLLAITKDSPDYVRAQAMVAEIFTEQGDRAAGLDILDRLLGEVVPSVAHLPALYQRGRILELEGRTLEAREVYLAVLRIDSTFRDAKKRVAALEQVATMQMIPPVPPGSAGGLRPPISTLSGEKVKATAPSRPPPPPPADKYPSGETPRIDLAGDLKLGEPRAPALAKANRPGSSKPKALQAPQHRATTPSAPAKAQSAPYAPKTQSAHDAPKSEPPQLPPPSAPAAASPLMRAGNLNGAVLRDRFRVERRVGAGGQAQVYLAHDRLLDRPVAIKVLNETLTDDPDALDRFLREARFAARVPHPKCLAIFDFGQERGVTFMAMEYFDGHTLKDRLKDGPIEARLSLRIARDIAEALGAAHSQGIVHRDVKPSNVMISQVQDVRLTDFGVAQNVGDEAMKENAMVGSLAYMSPEQANGDHVDGRADIFSLGVLIYEMLTGKCPFENSIEGLARRISQEPPPPPMNAPLGPKTRSLVHRAMQPDRRHRYPNVDMMLHDIDSARAEVEQGGSFDIADPDDSFEVTERIPPYVEEGFEKSTSVPASIARPPPKPDIGAQTQRERPAEEPKPRVDEESKQLEQVFELTFDANFEEPTRTTHNVFDDETAIGQDRAPTAPRPDNKTRR